MVIVPCRRTRALILLLLLLLLFLLFILAKAVLSPARSVVNSKMIAGAWRARRIGIFVFVDVVVVSVSVANDLWVGIKGRCCYK